MSRNIFIIFDYFAEKIAKKNGKIEEQSKNIAAKSGIISDIMADMNRMKDQNELLKKEITEKKLQIENQEIEILQNRKQLKNQNINSKK